MKPALRIPRPGLARLQTRRLHTYLHPPGEADDAEPHIFYNTDELPILGSSPAASRQRRIHSIPLRTGALAIKKGMMAMYDKETGIRTPCTVLQMDRVEVVDCKTMGLHGYFAVQVGAGLKHHTNVTRPELGHFARCGVSPKRFLAEFQVRDERGLIRSGTMLHPSWFLVGQFVDARANCRGMGFAGGMKRHGWSGQPASHGNSLSHRVMGSAGGSQGSGSRVHPGKNMPGRMGGQRVTVKSLKVLHVSDEEGIVVVNGCVPGPKRGLVMIQDALKKPWPDVPLSVPGAEFEHGLTVS